MASVGERVLAEWPQEVQWWYPGVVVSDAGQAKEVQFDDGGRATLTDSQMIPLSIGVGSRVYCRWKGGQQYFGGVVSSAVGSCIHVDYDDGDKESTSIAMVRVNKSDMR
jgi:hypothetical protein